MEKLCFHDSTIRIEVAFLRHTHRQVALVCRWGKEGGRKGTPVFSSYNLYQTPRLPLPNIQSKYKQCACYETYFLEKISLPWKYHQSCIKILVSPASRKPEGQPWLHGHAWRASSPVTSQDQDTLIRQRSQGLPSAGGKPFPDVHTRHHPAELRP